MGNKITWFFHLSSYYICWISCIYFAAHHQPYTGPIITLLFLAAQIFWQAIHQKPYREALYFAIALTILGSITDTIWLYADVIYFHSNPFGAHFSPPWMIFVWLSFGFNAIILYKKWLHHYFTWSMAVLISLPLAYWIGIKSGAAVLLANDLFYLYLGMLWALLLPLSFYIFKLLNKAPL